MTGHSTRWFKGYRITQYNIITDVLGGWSSSMEGSLSQLLGNKCKQVLKSSLHIVRTFKVVGTQCKLHFNHERHVQTWTFNITSCRFFKVCRFIIFLFIHIFLYITYITIRVYCHHHHHHNNTTTNNKNNNHNNHNYY